MCLLHLWHFPKVTTQLLQTEGVQTAPLNQTPPPPLQLVTLHHVLRIYEVTLNDLLPL